MAGGPSNPGRFRIAPDQVATWVAVLALISSVAFYWLQRNDALEIQRQQNAMALVELSYSDRLLAAQIHVARFIEANAELYRRVNLAVQAGDALPVRMPEDSKREFLTLVDFYERVLICRDVDRCDPKLIDELFGSDLCGFAGNAKFIGIPQLRPVYGEALGQRLLDYERKVCPLEKAAG